MERYSFVIHIPTIAELLHNGDTPAFFCVRWSTETFLDSLQYAVTRMIEDGSIEPEEADPLVYWLNKCAASIAECIAKTKTDYPGQSEESALN